MGDLAKYSITRSVARSLCDSWASCRHHWVLCSATVYSLSQTTPVLWHRI